MVRKEDHKQLLIVAVPANFRPQLKKAIVVAERNYGHIIRLSGEPLLHHVLRSARYYADLRIDFNGIVATLLHHRLPQAEYENKEIFNEDILQLLKNVELVFSNVKKESIDTRVIYKYILSFKDDIRVALLKLSEKFDNAKTIDLLPYEMKLNVAYRLLHIYAPLAEYMNLLDAQEEFKLNGFRVYYQVEYENVAAFIHKKQSDIYEKIQKVRSLLKDIAGLVKINGQVWGRVKSYYSIWKKISKHDKEGKSIEMDSFDDLLAFTFMVESVDQCYAVAYALKDYANVVDENFEDYIKNPKPNGFSEIQIVCRFPELVNINVEIQIMTKEMYWHNTYGPAAHFAYKIQGTRFAKENTEYQWVEALHSEIERLSKTEEMPVSKPLHMNLFQNKVFVFTPKHMIIELEKGSTALDFAYQVHSRIGDTATFAKINGVTNPLSTVLANGDIIEILTDSRKVYPTESWLEFSKSDSARTKIKQGIRKKLQDNIQKKKK